jgi:hypothetical protein
VAWTFTTTIDLGPAYSGLSDLRAQLYDTSGVASGAAISTGFSADLATGRGQYLWSYSSMADGFRGAVKFYSNASAAASSVPIPITAADEITAKADTTGGLPVLGGTGISVDTAAIADAVAAAILEDPENLLATNEDGEVTTSNPTLLTPFVATATNPRHTVKDIAPIYAGSTPTDFWIIKDAAGNAVDLSAKDLRLIGTTVENAGQIVSIFDDVYEIAWQYDTGGDGITVSGDDGNQVTIQHDAAKTATAGDYRYWLLNLTDRLVLVTGKYPIKPIAANAWS